ncbi:MAG: hypothetical protein ACKOE9_06405 [Vulcanococcus sp.]
MTSLHLLSDEQAQTVSGGWFGFVSKSNTTTVTQDNSAANIAIAGFGGAGIINLQGNNAFVLSGIV